MDVPNIYKEGWDAVRAELAAQIRGRRDRLIEYLSGFPVEELSNWQASEFGGQADVILALLLDAAGEGT
jgi:hypothetical protein